jgi:hypothetical protein
MRRGHRIVHRAIWPVLALAVAVGLFMALMLRKAPAAEVSPPAAQAFVR